MKKLWCWRCQMIVPMLEEEEYKEALEINDKAKKITSLKDRFQPLIDYHYKITGYKEENPNVIFHHALHLYGKPCEKCGKPYRTPQATFCAACGHKKIP